MSIDAKAEKSTKANTRTNACVLENGRDFRIVRNAKLGARAQKSCRHHFFPPKNAALAVGLEADTDSH